MIAFHRNSLFAILVALIAGLAIGLLSDLPFELTNNLLFFLAGTLVGLAGIAATLWVAAQERALNLGEIRKLASETKEQVVTLHDLAEQMWSPALSQLVKPQAEVVQREISEHIDTSLSKIAERLERQLQNHLLIVSMGQKTTHAAGVQADVGGVVEQLSIDVKSAVASMVSESQMMIRVTQIASLADVERYLLRRLSSWTNGEWLREAYWTTWVVPGTCPFPDEQISSARTRLLALGYVVRVPGPPQAGVQLAPGIPEGLAKFEEVFGPIHPTVEEERQNEEYVRAEYQRGDGQKVDQPSRLQGLTP